MNKPDTASNQECSCSCSENGECRDSADCPICAAERAALKTKKRRKDAVALVLLILTVLILFYFPDIVKVVRAGEAGVKFKRFRGGTVVGKVYPEGVHFLFPWDRLITYNVRYQSTNVNITILAESGLTLTMELTVRYRPIYDLLGVLHQKLGPDYVNTMVIPEIKSALRTTVGGYSAEEIYTSQRAILERVVDKSVDEVAQRYVEIDDVIIESIELPPIIKAAIEAKLTEKELLASYQFRLAKERAESERKIVEAVGSAEANLALTNSLTPSILAWKGIEATRILATSTNSKVIVIGNGPEGLPVILGNQ